MARRRSRSLVGFAAKDLCETIPKSLSPSERFMMLLEQSFQYALSTVQKEIVYKEGFDISTFRQKGTECWEKIKATIEEQNLDKSAVDKNGLCEPCVGNEVEEWDEAVAKMEAESEKWSDQISHYRECLQKEIDSSYSVKTSELKKENQLYNYSDIMKETSAVERTVYSQIHELSSCKATIQDCLDLHKSYDSCLHQQCEEHYHLRLSRTPRTILKQFALSKKINIPYE